MYPFSFRVVTLALQPLLQERHLQPVVLELLDTLSMIYMQSPLSIMTGFPCSVLVVRGKYSTKSESNVFCHQTILSNSRNLRSDFTVCFQILFLWKWRKMIVITKKLDNVSVLVRSCNTGLTAFITRTASPTCGFEQCGHLISHVHVVISVNYHWISCVR